MRRASDDVSVRLERDAWRVERTGGSGNSAEFVTAEDAEAFARRLARVFAPCWALHATGRVLHGARSHGGSGSAAPMMTKEVADASRSEPVVKGRTWRSTVGRLQLIRVR